MSKCHFCTHCTCLTGAEQSAGPSATSRQPHQRDRQRTTEFGEDFDDSENHQSADGIHSGTYKQELRPHIARP